MRARLADGSSPGSAEMVEAKLGTGSDPFFRGPFELCSFPRML